MNSNSFTSTASSSISTGHHSQSTSHTTSGSSAPVNEDYSWDCDHSSDTSFSTSFGFNEKCLQCPQYSHRNTDVSSWHGHSQTTATSQVLKPSDSGHTPNISTENTTSYVCEQEKPKKERNMPMSLCFALALRDAVYFAADSRSSIPLSSQSVGGSTLAVKVLDDDYLKITTIEVAGKTVVAYSTGLNQFDGKSFADYLGSLPVNQAETVQDGLEQICNKIRQLKMGDVFITFFYFTGLIDFVRADYRNDGEKSCEFIPGKLDGDHINGTYSGATWGMELAKRMILTADAKDESVISAVNDLFFRIRVLSPYFDNSIGGTIRIAKLTPDGFTWLQGEPTK